MATAELELQCRQKASPKQRQKSEFSAVAKPQHESYAHLIHNFTLLCSGQLVGDLWIDGEPAEFATPSGFKAFLYSKTLIQNWFYRKLIHINSFLV